MTELAVADATPESSDTPAPGDDIAAVADRFVTLMRAFNRARTRILAAAAHDVEWSAHVVLKCLQNEGSMRAGSLADCLLSDPSTVSRQVAALVKDGLLERRADPDDGRASLLALTDRGRDVLADHDRTRLRYFAEMLDGWTPQDLQQFTVLLTRFTEDFNQMKHEWVAEHIGAGTAHAGGNQE